MTRRRVKRRPEMSNTPYTEHMHHGDEEVIVLDPSPYGTHSLRRTKASMIYRRTKNIRAVQLLLGHPKIGITVRYLGVEVDDALEIAEQTDV